MVTRGPGIIEPGKSGQGSDQQRQDQQRAQQLLSNVESFIVEDENQDGVDAGKKTFSKAAKTFAEAIRKYNTARGSDAGTDGSKNKPKTRR